LPAPSRSPVITKRGTQLAAATGLAIATVLLVMAVLALAVFEIRQQGLASWAGKEIHVQAQAPSPSPAGSYPADRGSRAQPYPRS
jgi:hypothetical protein